MGLERLLITGSKGLLGSHILKEVPSALQFDLPEGDITDFDKVRKVFLRANPSLIIHCAAYTNVDAAEDNPDLAFRVNAYGTENVALVAQKLDVPMVYISTDAVFPGADNRAFKVWDDLQPSSTYGRSKAAGEEVVKRLKKSYIVRTDMIYGNGRSNFITQAIEKFKTEKVPVFQIIPQKIQLTYVGDLAKFILKLVAFERYGVYHYTNYGVTTRSQILEYLAAGFKINFYQEKGYKATAHRGDCPLDLSVTEELFGKITSWQESLKEFVASVSGETYSLYRAKTKDKIDQYYEPRSFEN